MADAAVLAVRRGSQRERLAGKGALLERKAASAGLMAAFAPSLNVSAWADRHRVLSKSASAEPGRWSTDRTPYLREIMDTLSPDSPVQNIVFQKSTQVGGTECGLNWIGSIIHQGLGPTMIVMPTSNAAKKASKTRVGPMIADTPSISIRVKEARSRDSGNTTLLKEFEGGVLIFAGANSATELKSSPIRNLFCDEVEEWPTDVDGQGDPEELAEKRTDTFAHRKIFKVSTPTIVGGRIDRAYRASDQRVFMVPCPHCEHEQQLRFERLRWETRKRWERVDAETGEVLEAHPDEPGAVERDTGELVDVWYECEGCSQAIPEHYKTQMLAAGRWVARNPGPDRAAGFHISALYSPIGWFGWRKVVLSWLKAEKDTSGQLRKTFTNTILGESYEEPGDSIDEHFLKRRIEAWRIGERIPAGALLLAAGCDVQHNRLEVRVWGYGRNYETWLVDRHVIFGSPAADETWSSLEQILDKAWPHELGGKLRISALAVDASDGVTTHFVRAFARKWSPTRRVIAVKGQAVQGKPLIGKPTEQDVSWRGRIIKGGVKMWPMGSDTGKAAFYARLRIEEPGPGYVHIPSGLPDETFAQLTAERMIPRYIRGHVKREWHLPAGKRNEDLDCRVMADAAAEYIGIRHAPWDKIERGLRIESDDLFTRDANANAEATEPTAADQGAAPATSAAPNKPAIRPRRFVKRGWANSWKS